MNNLWAYFYFPAYCRTSKIRAYYNELNFALLLCQMSQANESCCPINCVATILTCLTIKVRDYFAQFLGNPHEYSGLIYQIEF